MNVDVLDMHVPISCRVPIRRLARLRSVAVCVFSLYYITTGTHGKGWRDLSVHKADFSE